VYLVLIVTLLDALGIRVLRTSQCFTRYSKLYSTIIQDYVVNAWDYRDGQCIIRRKLEKG
jgi:hypothetical protein